MNGFVWETIEEINQCIADRLRNIRKRRKISQKELARISNVSYGSIKRFELTGEISLYSLTKLAQALGCVEEMRVLFSEVPYLSLEEVENERD